MRIELGCSALDASGAVVGEVAAVVFESESWRVAGFVIRLGDVAPREIVVAPGQVAEIGVDGLLLALDETELQRYPDAWQHHYVEPDQAPTGANDVETTSRGPVGGSIVPGFTLLPGLAIPLEIERSLIPETRFTFGQGLRAVNSTGDELGHVTALVVNETRLAGVELRGGKVVPDRLLAGIDEDANEVLVATESDTVRPEPGKFD